MSKKRRPPHTGPPSFLVEAARDPPFSRHFYMDIEAIPGAGGVDGKEIHSTFLIFCKVFEIGVYKRATFARILPYMKTHFKYRRKMCVQSREKGVCYKQYNPN